MKLFWISVLLIVFLKNLPLGLDKKSRNWYLIIAYFRSSSANSEFRYLSVSFCRSLLDLPHTSFPELFQSRDYLRWTKKCTFKIVVWFIIAVSSLEERISYRDLLFLTLEFVDFRILSMQDLQMNQAKQTNVKWLKSDHHISHKELNCASVH